MSTNSIFDPDDMFWQIVSGERPGEAIGTTRARMAARRECADKGHQYQVHGKANPTGLSCKRCGVKWAIGARTEPQT